jgi:hypothetical protein
MRWEQMVDKTGTGDMAMTVQRAAKGNLKRRKAEITLPKRKNQNRTFDGQTITHIIVRNTVTKERKQASKQETMFTSHPNTPKMSLLTRLLFIHQSVKFSFLLPNRDPILHISFFPSCTLRLTSKAEGIFNANLNIK